MKSYSLLCRLFNSNDCRFHFPSISSQFQISIWKTLKFSCSRLVSLSLHGSNSIFLPTLIWGQTEQTVESHRAWTEFQFRQRFVMFYLFWSFFFNCDLIYCSWSQCCAFPIMPLTSPQSWHRQPGTHQQITCVGVGGGGAPGRGRWCLSLKHNTNSNNVFFICQWSSLLCAFFFFFLLYRSSFLTRKCFVSGQFR